MINRRSLITGLISFVATPAIVRAESLMKLSAPIKYDLTPEEFLKEIMKPFCDHLEKQIADAILYGSAYGIVENGIYRPIGLQAILNDHS